MPSATRVGKIKTYQALGPQKVQTQYPPRRRSVKANAIVPRLESEQSTLTQHDFTNTPSSTSGDNHRAEQPRPRKKKRKSIYDEREEDQSSLTQMVRSGRRLRRHIELDQDGFQVWQDSGPNDGVNQIADGLWEPNKVLTLPGGDGLGAVERAPIPEIPESSQMEPAIASDPDLGTQGYARTRNARLQTPRKVRFTEIPCSQSPPDTTLFTRALVQNGHFQTSPLQERSSNVQSRPGRPASRESQNVTMKMLEDVYLRRSRRLVSRDNKDRIPQQENVSGRAMLQPAEFFLDDSTLGGLSNRVQILDAMIKDSYDHPADCRRPETIAQHPDTSQHAATPNKARALEFAESSQAAEIPNRMSRRPRGIRRVNTVQDSQYENVGLDLEEIIAFGYDDEANSIDHGQHIIAEGTFDPGMSALDRDAARFGWTQTQGRILRVEPAESESDDEDLDRGCSPNEADSQLPLALHDTPQKLAAIWTTIGIEEPRKQAVRHVKLPGASAAGDRVDEGAHESGDHPEVFDWSRIRSSPPPVRPSQVSTQVSTQASEQSVIRPESLGQCSSHKSHDFKPRSFASSPPKRSSYMPETVSSSPLPLPPWSSPEKLSFAGFSDFPETEDLSKAHEPLESLQDFSLPPPPPLSSSARQTPASSST